MKEWKIENSETWEISKSRKSRKYYSELSHFWVFWSITKIEKLDSKNLEKKTRYPRFPKFPSFRLGCWSVFLSPESRRKRCISKKIPHQEIMWNLGISRSISYSYALLLRNCSDHLKYEVILCCFTYLWNDYM